VKDEPADLGYWIGMEICRDYFARDSHHNPEAIVRGSSYAWILDGVN
jgi:hypothetical protein